MDFIQNTLLPLIGVNHDRSLKENVNRLKRKCEVLNYRKEDVESKMKTELKPGKKLKKEVELWLATVQRINDEKQSIENQVAKGRYLKRSCLGKLIAEKIEEVDELHQKGRFYDSLIVNAPPRNKVILPVPKLAGETTAKRKMEEIWADLLNDDVRKIGVYGMGGSGKTTIMKYINNRILKETYKFDSVIWVTVSKALDVKKLQNDIASTLDADISKYKDKAIRAAKLFAILREKKRYLLILDGMRKAFRLEVLGIPEPTLGNGCKIVLTTRSLDVCRRMDCKDIKMELLSKEEAWNLFLDNVGRDVLLTPSLEAIAKRIVEECACLPLAIIKIAESLKGVVDECEWRNALEETKKSTKVLNEMRKVLGMLKYSYNHLEDEMQQRCLLYCALYPEDFKIERRKLIEYLIVEGIIEGMRSRRAEFDKGHSILNKLENACLLESVTDEDNVKYVKMHDVVRDMALEIMGHGCMVKAGVQLRDLPNEEQWTEDLERVSLMNNQISKIPFGASLRCSRLSTLLLSSNVEVRSIPNSFFVHMRGLRILDLSYTGIEILPNSISDLENLTALLLQSCRNLRYVPSLAKLQTLRTLDLSGSRIEEVPHGMEMLVNLRCLNLRAGHLKMLPAGILSKLSCLQYLIVWWGSETLKVKAVEVAGLRKLETFAGQLYNLHDFNIYVRSFQGQGPSKYLLLVGPGRIGINFDEEGGYFSKYVGLRKCSIICGGEDPLVLPNDVESLRIEECHDVLSLNNATDFLKYCKIINCDGIECVLSSSSSSSSSCTPLQSLEELHLSELRNLRVLFRGEGASPPPPPPLGTFSHLKQLDINDCPNVKKLFTPGLLAHLQNLEEICVHNCEGMEEIIAAKAGEEEQGMGESSKHPIVNNDDTIFTITIPKLRLLSLRDLPELKSIICSRGIMVCDSLQDLTVRRCPKLKRLPLSLPMLNGLPSSPPALRVIEINDREWWESLEWDHPYAKHVLQSFTDWRR